MPELKETPRFEERICRLLQVEREVEEYTVLGIFCMISYRALIYIYLDIQLSLEVINF